MIRMISNELARTLPFYFRAHGIYKTEESYIYVIEYSGDYHSEFNFKIENTDVKVTVVSVDVFNKKITDCELDYVACAYATEYSMISQSPIVNSIIIRYKADYNKIISSLKERVRQYLIKSKELIQTNIDEGIKYAYQAIESAQNIRYLVCKQPKPITFEIIHDIFKSSHVNDAYYEIDAALEILFGSFSQNQITIK